MSRDTKFYSELKQLNEDLLEALKKHHSKSAYNDFSPTLLDYVKQFDNIEKKYPKGNNGLNSINNTATTTITSTTNSTAPTIATSTANSNGPLGFKFTSSGFNLTSSDTFSSTANNKPSFLFGSAVTNAPPTTTAPLFSFGSALNQAPAQPPLFSFTLPKPPAPSAASEPVNEPEEVDEQANPPEPNIDKYEETDAKIGVKRMIYVKALDDPNKLQVIFRQEPDLRRVLFNEIVTAQMPAPKLVPKTVQMVFPPKEPAGKPRFFVAKFASEDDASKFHKCLSFATA